MTIQELIGYLQTLPPKTLVVMSKDAEGNQYAPLADIGMYRYRADNTWSGEILPAEEDDLVEDNSDTVPAVVFWPV